MHERAVLRPLEFDDDTVECISQIVETRRSRPYEQEEDDDDDEVTMISIDVVTDSLSSCPDSAALTTQIEADLAALPTLPVRKAMLPPVRHFLPAPSPSSPPRPKRDDNESLKFLMSWFAMGISIGLFVTGLIALVLNR